MQPVYTILLVLCCFVVVWALHRRVDAMVRYTRVQYLREGFESTTSSSSSTNSTNSTTDTPTTTTQNMTPTVCPTELTIDHRGRVFLHNDQFVDVPGVNPVQLPELSAYGDFMAWMKQKGYRCPYLQANAGKWTAADGRA